MIYKIKLKQIKKIIIIKIAITCLIGVVIVLIKLVRYISVVSQGCLQAGSSVFWSDPSISRNKIPFFNFIYVEM